MPQLPVPSPDDVLPWVAEHLGALALEGPDGIRAGIVPGGQQAADAALADLVVPGYASRRSTVLPETARGASRLSPYIRHGLLPLPRVWRAAGASSGKDRDRYRDELMWQEYARHLYAAVGGATRQDMRYAAPRPRDPWPAEPWPQDMNCVASTTDALYGDGWLVNQTRMWLASQWTVRAGADWRAGEDEFYRNLLDGSRAANRLGWQWSGGQLTGKVYGFSRWQVEKRAPGLCATCALRDRCPIEDWPDTPAGARVPEPAGLSGPADPERVAGPVTPQVTGEPAAVWLTAESLGDDDPALAGAPELPAVFVFDAPLLTKLRLSGKRLVFLTETLAELATRRRLEIRLGDPVQELARRALATTFAPVPGWARRAARLQPAAVHPWPWLVRPTGRPVRSYSAWRKTARVR